MLSACSFLRTRPQILYPSGTSKSIMFQPMKPGPTIKTCLPAAMIAELTNGFEQRDSCVCSDQHQIGCIQQRTSRLKKMHPLADEAHPIFMTKQARSTDVKRAPHRYPRDLHVIEEYVGHKNPNNYRSSTRQQSKFEYRE